MAKIKVLNYTTGIKKIVLTQHVGQHQQCLSQNLGFINFKLKLQKKSKKKFKRRKLSE